MAEPASDSRMLTLSEVSQRTGISMPTLQRYKKIYQSRIPAEGKGRKQRYPESALPVFEELKVENAGRRGRPRKNASAPASSGNTGGARRGRKPGKAAPAAAAPVKRSPGRPRKNAAPAAPVAAKAARKSAAAPARGGRKAASAVRGTRGRRGSGSGLLTLGQVSEQTGISYPTLVRYVRVHSDRLPSEGTGRSRRFHPEAVGVFRELRQESGRGGRKPNAAKTAKSAKTAKAAKTVGRGRGPGRPAAAPAATDSGLTKRLRSLERTQQDLEKRFRGFVQSLQKLFK
jgi:predicted DNA-binding transcriptional regulator AlpA